jgi:membrane-associated phospholipid phosphatase
MMGLVSSFLVCAAMAAAPKWAHATVTKRPERAAARLDIDLRVDVPLLVGSLTTVVGTRVADVGPDVCRWCERGDLNAVDGWFRDKLRAEHSRSLEVAVGATTGLLLLGTLGLDVLGGLSEGGGARTLAVDALIIGETIAVALAFTSISKAVVGRQRPYALTWPDEAFDGSPRPKDENASFFSGHTAVAFSLVASSATVATLRGYRTAPYLWIGGLTLASATALFRISQDEHYFTDLLAGAIVGAGVGVAVPYLHRATPVAVAAVPVGDGYQVCLTVRY